MRERVLFICTHNSARSQMAEGIMNHFYRDHYEAFSAGTEPTHVNPLVIRVMQELGIDISHHRSKSIDEFREMSFDYVVTVCDHAHETCPYFPNGRNYIHHNFTDPSTLTGDTETLLEQLRIIRDNIRDWIDKTFRRA